MRPNGRPFRGGRGGFKRQDFGPPEEYVDIGHVTLRCPKEVVCKLTHKDIPYFNAPVYNEKHTEIGKIDDVLGRVDSPMFSVTPLENLSPESFTIGQRVIYLLLYIICSFSRFLSMLENFSLLQGLQLVKHQQVSLLNLFFFCYLYN